MNTMLVSGVSDRCSRFKKSLPKLLAHKAGSNGIIGTVVGAKSKPDGARPA